MLLPNSTLVRFRTEPQFRGKGEAALTEAKRHIKDFISPPKDPESENQRNPSVSTDDNFDTQHTIIIDLTGESTDGKNISANSQSDCRKNSKVKSFQRVIKCVHSAVRRATETKSLLLSV